jgi:hypothetical protein
MARRAFAGRLLALVIGAASLTLSAPVPAQQGKGRLDPDERERLRQALRERGTDGWPARDAGSGRSDPGRGAASRAREGPSRERLSDDERAQLRRQLREAGRSRD